VANGWTPERRARQAALIHTWRPWERSIGPKTAEGKARSKMNGYKGGQRPQVRELARLLRQQRRVILELPLRMPAVDEWDD
jgi:hypothetical protein